MVFVKDTQKFEEINFLKSEKFVSFTTQVDSTHAGVVGTVLPAGSVVPANDATAQGITINAVDVSNDPQAVGMIVEGHILEERLPEEVTVEAKTALKNITFYDETGSYQVGGGL